MIYSYYTDEHINELASNEVFTFGSNLAGGHGAGAARTANKLFGARYGVGSGLTGQCYALATKDINIRTLPLSSIAKEVETFKAVAKDNLHLQFIVTKVGCGLAGYSNSDIAPLFKGCSTNCQFHVDWYPYLEEINE